MLSRKFEPEAWVKKKISHLKSLLSHRIVIVQENTWQDLFKKKYLIGKQKQKQQKQKQKQNKNEL